MAAKNIQSDDLILVNRGGVDYQAKVSDLSIGGVDLSAIKDGKLTIEDSDGAIVGEFTANQSGPTNVTLPKGFSGDFYDLTNVPKYMPLDLNTLPPLT